MEVITLKDLEVRVHSCKKCKESDEFLSILLYPPVYSFGDPQGKEILIVGQNPSCSEYTGHFLLDGFDIEKRRQSQLAYFERQRPYKFFDELGRFFDGEVKNKIQYVKTPWEKIGFVDLVKCPTKAKDGQWSKLSPTQKKYIINNCQDYIIEQLSLYSPKVIIAYGAGVGRWFSNKFNVRYEEFEDVLISLNGAKVSLIFVPQRQGPHSKLEVICAKKKILNAIP